MIDAQLLKLKDKQAAERAQRAEAQKKSGAAASGEGAVVGSSSSSSSSGAFQDALSRFYKK